MHGLNKETVDTYIDAHMHVLGLTVIVPCTRVSVSLFLHHCIPSSAFTFPNPQDVPDVDISDIITQVNPSTTPGRTYTLSRIEMPEATMIVSKRL